MAPNTAVKVLDRPPVTSLGEIVSAEFDRQIETAKRFPREEGTALRQLEQLACRSDPVAESCMYTLKRRDKGGAINWITGPSVRFAELLNYCWGNMRAGARIIEEGEKAVVAQGIAYDLQRNTGLSVEIRRGILTSGGQRFGADMVNVTSNAACSIALRNAIFDAIPQVLWWDVYEIVKEKAVGAAQVPERLQQAVKFFVSKGATEADILKALDVKAIEDMGRDHLEIFIGLRTALKEGTIKAETIFTAEAAEERSKLSLISEAEDSFSSIDKQLQGGQARGGKKDGADPKAGAAKEAPVAAQRDGDKPKGKGGKAKADSAKAAAQPQEQAAGGGQPADSEQPRKDATGAEAKSKPGETKAETDEQFVDRVEQEHHDAPRLKKDKPIKAAKARLELILLSDDKALAGRADKLLNLYDLDEPED